MLVTSESEVMAIVCSEAIVTNRQPLIRRRCPGPHDFFPLATDEKEPRKYFSPVESLGRRRGKTMKRCRARGWKASGSLLEAIEATEGVACFRHSSLVERILTPPKMPGSGCTTEHSKVGVDHHHLPVSDPAYEFRDAVIRHDCITPSEIVE